MIQIRARPALGVAMVLGGGVLFAVNGTVAKLVLGAGIDAPRLTTLRATGAFAGLLILCLVLRPGRLRLSRREVPLVIVYGLAGFFLVPMLYFVAISRLPVGIALLFEFTAPLFVALWARFGQHARVRPRLWVGLALSLTGLACVAEVWGDIRLDGLGIAAGFGAAVLLAGYYVLGARGVTRRDPLTLTCWAFGFAAIAGLAVRPWWTFPAETLSRTRGGVPIWLLCAYVVVLGSIVPYLLVAGALRHLPATSVGIIGMVEPIIAATVAWLALSEALNPAQLTGGGLVLLGVVLAETARARPDRDPATPDRGPATSDAPEPSKMEGMQVHPNVQAVQDALESAGAVDGAGTACRVRMLPDAVHTAVAAAAALDVEVGQIANSLIFDADGDPLLVLTSGAHRVDTAKVAALAGVAGVRRATPDFVREHTGQPIGGVAPLGHPKPVRTLVDTALGGYDEIWAAGGIPHAVFPTTYEELVRITAGSPADVA